MRNLVIFGDTSYAERLYIYIAREGLDRVIAFTQEKDFVSRKSIQGIPVLNFEDIRDSLQDKFEIILGIGYTKMNQLKAKILKKCKNLNYPVGSYISRNAIVYSDDIGEGTFIAPGAIIGPGCIIGIGNYLASAVVLSHDNIIGDYNFFSTNSVFGGFAQVNNNCFFGLHSTIKDGISINDNNLIGSGANVLKSIDYIGGVFVGNPAKQLLNKDSFTTTI